VDTTELHRLAVRQLADIDALTPNRLFAHSPELTAAEAYQLQEEIARLREQRGETVIGYKVGCTSRAVQEQLGITEPIFGRLFDTGCHYSDARLSSARYARLAVEGELAVRLSRDLPASALAEEACADAVEDMFPVIELHHFELCSPRPNSSELIASNGMHAGLVLATEQGRKAGRWREPAGLTIRIDATGGVIEESSSSSRPLASLRWLASRLAEAGLRLLRGQVVLTGSPMRLFPVTPDSRIVVDAGPLGRSCAEIIP
jgi:2-keto-4-pentenoate hydratase